MSEKFTKGWILLQQTAPDATQLCEQLDRLERALSDGDSSGTIDYSKSLLESLFKTIIFDIDGSVNNDLTFTQLFREVRSKLQFSSDAQASEWLGQVCSAAVAKIGELRNRFGAIGHGADGYQISPLNKIESEFVASITDSIVCYLFQIHKSNPERFLNSRIHYIDNSDFNDWLNGEYPDFRITLGARDEESEIVYVASEVIFNSDYDTYKELLIQYRRNNQPDENNEE
jgi:hypothetical protein